MVMGASGGRAGSPAGGDLPRAGLPAEAAGIDLVVNRLGRRKFRILDFERFRARLFVSWAGVAPPR